MHHMITRRTAVAAAAAAPLAVSVSGKPASLGGEPVRKEKWPGWPKISELEEREIVGVLRSGRWGRGGGKMAEQFEAKYAALTGAKHCLAVANGTSALITSLNALGVGAGDEVIVPPYTFIATVNAVLLQHALPVFVDSDLETFQMDVSKLEAAITPQTVALMPVHLGGASFDLDKAMDVAKRRNLPLVEDACQAHLGEWRGKKVGTLGTMGCFSFQASKNLNSGEGGAVVTNDDALIEKLFTFHNNGRTRKVMTASFSYELNGANLRLTEFQAALLLAQMTRLEDQARLRDDNAARLTALLKDIPGIAPQRITAGCTRNAWHLYMFRYDEKAFAGLSRAKFLKALAAEGVPCSSGYSPLNREPFLKTVMQSRGYQRVYGAKRLREWEERNRCPVNDRLCREAVWFTQTMLLDTPQGMEQIAAAIRKIQTHAADLARA